MRMCKKCGAKLEEGQKFCDLCGEKAESVTAGEQPEPIYNPVNDNNQPQVEQPISETEDDAQQRAALKAFMEKQGQLSNNYALGFLGAVAGGLVAAIPWAIVSSLGWFVAWLGFLIAVAASKGYDLMKVKTNMAKLWCVIGAVVIGVLAGQIMSDMISIAVDKELGGMFAEIFTYFSQNFGEYLSINSGNLVLGYIFAAWGGFRVFKEIKQETALLDELRKRNMID